MNYYQLLKKWAERQPEKLFLAVDGTKWNYQEALTQTDRLAGRLRNCLANRRQGGVLVLADTPMGQLLGFFALQALSVRPILLHHGMPDPEVAAILRKNRLQGLLTLTENPKSGAAGSVCFTEEKGENTEGGIFPEKDDILGVLSSGSTGTPKVMYRTYESWAGFFPIQNAVFHVTRETKLFLQGSLSFTGNLNSLLSALYAGGSIITSSKIHCRQWISLIERWQADVIYLVPAKLQLLAAAAARPLTGVRALFTGSQLLSPRNLRELQRLLPNAELILYYGASELNYITYAVCDDPDRDPCNLGRPFPGIRVTIKDGLIYVDTPYHVSGAKIPFTVKDTGRLNEQGELIFGGRCDAWINKGGYKISTLRLENEIRAIDGVREAVVIPCRDALRGSTAAAFVVPEQQAGIPAVRSAIRQALKPAEIPDVIRFVPHIPRNDRGKADCRTLRAMLGSRSV